MKLSEVCIERPVLATVLSLILILVGIVGYQRLDLRYFPKVDKPTAWVETAYPGASAELVENTVTRPLEDALAEIEGVESIESTSYQGRSQITVQFRMSNAIEYAEQLNDVRNAVGEAQRKLPSSIDTPKVRKSGDSGQTVMIMGLTDAKRTPLELRDYADRFIKDQLSQIPGVANVNVWGADRYAMRIWLDPSKMASVNVTVNDVKQALKSGNLDVPAGEIQSSARYYTINANTRLKDISAFQNLIVRKSQGRTIRLKDIATVKLGSARSSESLMRINGKPGVGIEILAQPEANPIDVTRNIRQKLTDIKQQLPQGMQLNIGMDLSIFLKASIDEVYKTIVEAALLVTLITVIFLASFRAALIPIVTIPVCIIAAFGLMLMLGFSINLMTLLALVLAIGLVVDDAIVVLENIYRNIELGLKPLAAARKGMQEISFAIIAMTITLVAVYAPLGFMNDYTATIFREFAFTLAGSVLISGFVALTLSPMMCSRILTNKHNTSPMTALANKCFATLDTYFRRLLTFCLRWRAAILLILLVIAATGYSLFRSIPMTFVPKEDVSIAGVFLRAPASASIGFVDKYAHQVENIIADYPEIQTVYSMIGHRSTNTAFNYLTLSPWNERDRSTDEVVQNLDKKLNAITGVRAFAFAMSPMGHGKGGGSTNNDLSVQILTNSSYEELNATMNTLISTLEKSPIITSVDSDLDFNSQEFNIEIDRDLAADLQVNIDDIANTISTMLGGNTVGDFQADNQSYDVILQIEKIDLKDFNSLKKLYVNNANGKQIPISNLISITPNVTLSSRDHYDRMRTADLDIQLAPGYKLSDGMQYLQTLLPQLLPGNDKYEFSGAAKDLQESNSNMLMIFGLALAFIYLVLAALFESFIDPLIILLTVPLCFVGALLALKWQNGSLNLYTNIGLVTLIGLISKHGILITQFANERLAKGVDSFTAVVEAASIRLRPILMTTATMVLGALPLALAVGPGSVSRSQIGWVIVSGLLFGTFFSLIVVPVAYTYLAKFKQTGKS